ncbi:MAG: hypothetical protein PETM_02701 [Petrimonas sp.]
MELKYVIAEHDDEFQVYLLIAPLMELKCNIFRMPFHKFLAFNRTAYGIEMWNNTASLLSYGLF